MIAQFPAGRDLPRLEIEALIDRHGPRAVLRALLLVLARRQAPPRRKRPDAPLGAHLRRDIGLPPEGARPVYWRYL